MTRQECLKAAERAVVGKSDTYGTPEGNFQLTADLWSKYLKHPVSKADVAALLVLLKIARLRATPSHGDSWVDIAGYAACGAEVST